MKKKVFHLIIVLILSAAVLCIAALSGGAGQRRAASSASAGSSRSQTDEGETETETETETESESESETETETKSETETEEETVDPETLIDFSAQYPYIIYVNRSLNRVVVYGIDYDGNYTVPYLGFVCSVGTDNKTVTGTFQISDKYEWRQLVDGSYGQYAVRIYKGILFHSVPYTSMSKDTLETEEYNKLGQAASLGCIRLAVIDAKWIYDNCPKGTTVVIYDDEDEEFEVEFRETITIDTDSEFACWDPTDPDENNPWNLS